MISSLDWTTCNDGTDIAELKHTCKNQRVKQKTKIFSPPFQTPPPSPSPSRPSLAGTIIRPNWARETRKAVNHGTAREKNTQNCSCRCTCMMQRSPRCCWDSCKFVLSPVPYHGQRATRTKRGKTKNAQPYRKYSTPKCARKTENGTRIPHIY